jgi:hypothetical protein
VSESGFHDVPDACRIGHLRMAGSLQHNREAMRRVVRASLVSLATAGLGGCLFVDTINTAPTAGIRRVDLEAVRRGGQVTVEAVVDDVDDDDLSITWGVTVCDRDQRRCRRLDDVVGNRAPHVIAVPAAVEGSVLVERLTVELTVRDERGAVAIAPAPLEVLVENAEPALGLVQAQWRGLGTSFPVHAPVELLVTKAVLAGEPPLVDVVPALYFDSLPVTGIEIPSYRVDGDPPELLRFTFRPDRVGRWTVAFALTDSLGTPGEALLELDIVDDRHPCIESLSPSFAGPLLVEAPRRLSVLSVSDDKDEYPAAIDGILDLGVATFRWSRSRPGAPDVFEPIGESEAADLVIDPALHAPGDHFAVRVDVDDRVARPACRADDDRCEEQRPEGACARRMTWEIEIR